MELVLCVSCRRHVGVRERTCPFCARALPVQQPQRATPRSLTRAAIFSAALVACESKQAPQPAPAPATQQDGSDDLEKLLDVDTRVVEHPSPPADAAVDAAALAQAVDAGVPVDAGQDPAIAQRRREAERRRRERRLLEEQRRREEIERQKNAVDLGHVQHAKPYGAPPARRRVV